jgi:hypothetical protein
LLFFFFFLRIARRNKGHVILAKEAAGSRILFHSCESAQIESTKRHAEQIIAST